MARKAIADESEASRQQSREHAKGGLQSLALVVGGVVDGILTSTLDASVVEGLAEGVSPFDGGSGDQQADDEWFDAEGGKLHGWAVSASLLQAAITATAIGLERRARAIEIASYNFV